MGVYFIVAAVTVIGIIVIMGRLNLKRFLGYPNVVDISCTILFLYIFAGTLGGMIVAAFASLFMSGMLWALRSSIGAERLSVKRGRFFMPVLYWRVIPARECQPHWLATVVMTVLRNKAA